VASAREADAAGAAERRGALMRAIGWQRRFDGLATIVAFMAFCYVLALLVGCTPPKSVKEAAAEGAYGAELQLCVDNNESAAAIDTCADTVRAKWADAGAR
jgi:hypothetical protein